jgi:hypothetical protein
MFEMDRVAEILGGAVKWLLHGCGPGSPWWQGGLS